MFVYEDAGYKVISSSVVMGAVANGDSLNIKPYLLSEFVNYFIGYNPVTTLAEHVENNITGEVFPNPFNDKTAISFTLSRQEKVTVAVFSLNGHLVKTLADAEYSAGKHEITWNGKDHAGHHVINGVYLCVIQSGSRITTKKLIILPQGSE
jgi:hypothetical protein